MSKSEVSRCLAVWAMAVLPASAGRVAGAEKSGLFVPTEAAAPRSAEFAAGPVVTPAGKGAEITFAAKGITDVVVEVLGPDGKVIRHLAAGVLGGKAPAPLQAGSLAQRLTWDGNDDAGRQVLSERSESKGKPVPAGKCSVRVALGLRPAFERVFAWRPQELAEHPQALAVDAKGVLYVMFVGQHRHHTPGLPYIVAYGREGKYLRQVMPFPASLKREQVAGVKTAALGPEGWMPLLYDAAVHNFYPNVEDMDRQTMAVTAGGTLLLAGSYRETMHDHYEEAKVLLRLGTGGSAADFVGPHIGPCRGSFVHLAASPDGKTVYAAGLRGRNHRDGEGVHHIVYRSPIDAKAGGKFEAWLGQREKPGDAGGLLNDPRGLACDAQGNLYVCEHGNGRIQVYSPQGSLLGSVPVKDPDVIAVHPKTGRIYVVCSPNPKGNTARYWASSTNWHNDKRLIKLAGWKDPKVEAEMTFRGARTIMALDAAADEPVVYLGQLFIPSYRYDGTFYQDVPGGVFKVIDRGGKFENLGRFIFDRRGKQPGTLAPIEPSYISIDRAREVILAGSAPYNAKMVRGLYDGTTGRYLGTFDYHAAKGVVTRFDLGEDTFAPDGAFIVHQSGLGEVIRLGPDGKRLLTFEATSRPTVEPLYKGWDLDGGKLDEHIKMYGRHQRQRGPWAGPNHDIYVAHHKTQSKARDLAVSHVTAGGVLKRYAFIQADAAGGGVRIDRGGNVYVGASVHPGDDAGLWPLSGRLPAIDRHKATLLRGQKAQLGSIVKFGPEGGSILRDPAGTVLDFSLGLARGKPAPTLRPVGVKWMYYGLSPVPGGLPCVCESARFDLDAHDRLFIPEASRFSVAVVDSEGNFICRFGRYGNMDSAGPGSAVPDPAIAFAWPMAVCASDSAAYVGDFLNYRIVKVRLAYQTEKTVPVTVP